MLIVRKWSITAIAVTVLIISASVWAGITNPDFELCTDQGGMCTPDGWDTENYVSVVESFVPHPPSGEGNSDNWHVDLNEPGLLPYESNHFVVISTDDTLPEPWIAKASQEIVCLAGDKLTGAYFFGTCDYAAYIDYATVTLIAPRESNLPNIVLAYVDVNMVGNYSSTEGWQSFEHTFTEQDAGDYQLELLVSDVGDPYFPSYLAVDGLRLCPNSDYGELTGDCRINIADYAIAVNYWLESCAEPNWCASADINRDGLVDFTDLEVIAGNWLRGP